MAAQVIANITGCTSDPANNGVVIGFCIHSNAEAGNLQAASGDTLLTFTQAASLSKTQLVNQAKARVQGIVKDLTGITVPTTGITIIELL